MLSYPEIDPVALSLGPLQVHWYGVMYLLSFLVAWRLALIRSRQPWSPLKADQVEDFIFYGALGVIIGGRLGYVFFYQFDRFLADPAWLFRVWEGGMAYHGGVIGVVTVIFWYGRRIGQSGVSVGDFIVPMIPVGSFFGRFGNFIGQELWGRPTEGWWGMVFPNDPLGLARHPSQLYQALLEGLTLFIVLWLFSRSQRPRGAVAGLFLLGYGLCRFVVEFVREPDGHLADSLWFDWMTRGQVLSIPMMLIGATMMIWAYNRPKTQ